MLVPKKMKHRKTFRRRGSFKGSATRNISVDFGEFGLKAMETKEITSRQIEAARRAMTRYVKRGGKIWIKIFPHKVITRKAAEVPMGSGKGSPEFYAALVKKGTVLFEMAGVDPELAKEAMKRAAQKLPVKCKFINTHEK